MAWVETCTVLYPFDRMMMPLVDSQNSEPSITGANPTTHRRTHNRRTSTLN